MKVIRVKSLKEANVESFEIINEIDRHNTILNIALTGGRFGKEFSKYLAQQRHNSFWRVFQTDERINSHKDVIQKMLINNLSTTKDCIFIFFKTNATPKQSIKNVVKELNSNSITSFDICFLSLGEDGHLAGQFHESKNMQDARFCYTSNSPKPPKERLSFSIEWLYHSKKIILIVLGKEKKEALEDLLAGNSTHSYILKNEGLILITDLL